jgi:ketosteroid isomerase-like protein
MSQENVERVRQGYDALNRRDYEAWLSTLHPDVELYEIPTNPDAAVFRGRDQLREWTRSVFEVASEGSRFEPETFQENGRFVLVGFGRSCSHEAAKYPWRPGSSTSLRWSTVKRSGYGGS